jgi:hypothetical protein
MRRVDSSYTSTVQYTVVRRVRLLYKLACSSLLWVREPDYPVTGYLVPIIQLYLDNL